MAYPPTVPPVGRANATPQVDNHPGDHNSISAALTDIINELGANPSGTYANLTARIDYDDTRHGITVIGAPSVPSGALGQVTWTTYSNPDWGNAAVLIAPAGTAGLHIVTCTVIGPTIKVGTFADIILSVNTPQYFSYIPPGKTQITVSALANLAPGDQVGVQVYNPNDAAAFFNATLNIYRVAP